MVVNKVCRWCGYNNAPHDEECHHCGKELSSAKIEEVCLGPLGCKKGSMYVFECCKMNGEFHSKPIEKPKGPFVFEDRDGFTIVPG